MCRYMYLSTSTMNNLLTACHALWNADVTLVCCMVLIVYFLWLLKIYFNTILSGTGRCKVYLERRERKLRRLDGPQVTQQASLVQNWSLKLYINFFLANKKSKYFSFKIWKCSYIFINIALLFKEINID